MRFVMHLYCYVGISIVHYYMCNINKFLNDKTHSREVERDQFNNENVIDI